MKKSILLTIIFSSIFPIHLVVATENFVAKVILMKGEVRGKSVDGSLFQVKLDQDIPEGATIQTAEKSFVKLLFIDKSQMNLGPKSQMVINAFPQKDPGIITLVKGQLRSKVTKDYMEIDDKSKSKLFIKTSSAAMGIRGTDFQVNYNEINRNTALITFEGAVAMAHLDRSETSPYADQRQLEHVVSSEKAVIVKEGQVSAVNNNISQLAMIPTKLGTAQISALKDNETGIKESPETPSESGNKNFRSPIPPGVDGAILSSTPKQTDSREIANANGFFNQKTGEYKLPAGSIIDLNSVNIIPPPVNAVFDPNSKSYVVPTTFGKIDPSSGEYRAPEGLKLGTDGKFQVVPKQEINKENISTTERAPSSETVTAPPTAPAPNIYAIRPEMEQFAGTFATNVDGTLPPPPAKINAELTKLANEVINTTETFNNNASDLGTIKPTTNLKIILNVQQ